MKLSVVIVSYNVKYYLEQCLEALQRSLLGIDSEVYVVDNHSRDGSVAYLRERFPEVSFVESLHNLGFARANNMAIRQTKGEYVLLLNPDTVVGESTLMEALVFMDSHADAGALGVRMLNAYGESAKESRRGLPSPMVAFYKMTGLCDRFPENRRLGHYYMGYLPWDEACEIEVVSGAFCLLRREALDKVGLLDEDFFMYGEDIDLSYRVLKGGYRNYYLPARILHYKGESTQKSSFRYVHVFYEAMLIFFKKHYAGMSLLFSVPVKAAIYGKATIALFKMQVDKVRKSLGFFSDDRAQAMLYVFIGGDEMLAKCRQLARDKGLDALYIKGDAQSLPDGHLSAEVTERLDGRMEAKVAVYDTSAYSYEQVFDIFAVHPDEKLRMGFYHLDTERLITDEQVM